MRSVLKIFNGPFLLAVFCLLLRFPASASGISEIEPQNRVFEGVAVVQSFNNRLIWLDKTTKTIYERRSASNIDENKDPHHAWVGSAEAAVLWSGKPLSDPIGITISESGIVYVLDGQPAAIFAITRDKKISLVYSGSAIAGPSGIAVADNQLYVSDSAAHKLVRFDLTRRVINQEYESKEFQPDKLIYRTGVLYAADYSGRSIYSFFVSADHSVPTAGVPTTPEVDESWKVAEEPEERKIRGGKITRITDDAVKRVDDFDVSDNVVFLLDGQTKSLALLPLPSGEITLVTPGYFVPGTSAIAVDDKMLYMADGATGQLAASPLVLPTKVYFVGGKTSENILAFYDYLNQFALLPTKSYRLREGDTLAEIVKDQHVVPTGYVRDFDRLFCKLNKVLCDTTPSSAGRPARYKTDFFFHLAFKSLFKNLVPGQVFLLPDPDIRPYLGQRPVTLPIDKKMFPEPRFARHANGQLGDLAREFISRKMSDTELEVYLNDLNPSYKRNPAHKDENILQARIGYFLIPVESWQVQAVVPKAELLNNDSSLGRLISRNVFAVSPVISAQPQSTVEPTSAPHDGDYRAFLEEPCEQVTYDACDVLRPPCNKVPSDVCGLLKDIHYLAPRLSPAGVRVGIIDTEFNSENPEFRNKDGTSALTVFKGQTSTTSESIVTDATQQSADPNSPGEDKFKIERDHGNHVAALIGGRGHLGQMVGMNNWAKLYGISPSDFPKALELPEYRTLTLYNVSQEDPLPNAPGNALNPLKRYMREQPGVLFVVSAGNHLGPVTPDSIAAESYLENVIVVGAAAKGGLTLVPKTASGSDDVTIAAPGDKVRSTLKNKGYDAANGTSPAAALVSGAASLLRVLEPTWSPWQIKQRLVATADLWTDTDAANSVFSGMLNIQRAVSDRSSVALTTDDETPPVETIGDIPDEFINTKSLEIKMGIGQQNIVIPYKDILRIKRENRGQTQANTFTIIYQECVRLKSGARCESASAGGRKNHILLRLVNVVGQDIVGDTMIDFYPRADEPSLKRIAVQNIVDFINRVSSTWQ